MRKFYCAFRWKTDEEDMIEESQKALKDIREYIDDLGYIGMHLELNYEKPCKFGLWTVEAEKKNVN